MEKLQTILMYIRRRKYLVVTVGFLLIIGVLDENNLLRRLSQKSEIADLKSEISKYRSQYEEDTRKLIDINENPEAIEKIAREKYLMQTPDEDIFIFE